MATVTDKRHLEADSSPVKKRRFCPHCSEVVGYSTYYRHRDKYFDLKTQQWTNPAEVVEEQETNCVVETEEGKCDATVYEDDYVSEFACNTDALDDDLLTSSDELLTADHDSDSMQEIIDNNTDIWLTSSSDSDSAAEETSNNENVLPYYLKNLFVFLMVWQFAFNISNNAISYLLRFLKFFIMSIGIAFQSETIKSSSDYIPVNLKALHKSLLIAESDFVKYVVCPKCDSIYEYSDCIITRGNGDHESKTCCHVSYPNHSHMSKRKPCGATLMKKVKTKSGYCLKPQKVYPYLPLQKSFERLVKRRDFISKCEEWCSRATLEQTFSDIYDGLVWKSFESSFLNSPNHYLLTMNVDWFEPYERGVYSVGVIYLTIQNLPREERYKLENIVLVGIIPGPKEPKLTINSFLSPLVIDLKEAWTNGFNLTSHAKVMVTVKVALTCVACDLPASRKICGFLSHNASLGCNKCYKKFKVSFGERTDYSGFDRENWPKRSLEKHREDVHKVIQEVTKTKISEAESKYGVRYSVLLSLPYFDPVRFTVIDIMHNMYLGTGKHLFQTWIDEKLLINSQLTQIDNMIKLFRMPADSGRIPSNIMSSYGSFTASQWKNWITVYSPIILKGFLPVDHLQCWLLFVRSCCLLSSRIVKESDITCADLYLLNFCKRFEQLYPHSCTPNLHLHLHLKDSFLDYGPPHAFWCFAFERFNGVLGSYHTNKKAIEEQLLRKFCQNQIVHDIASQCDDISSLFPNTYCKQHINTLSEDSALLTFKLGTASLDGTLTFDNVGLVAPLSPFKSCILDAVLLQHLHSVYSFLYPQLGIRNKDVLPFYDQYGRVTLAGDLIGSTLPGPNNSASSVIAADWPGTGTGILNNTCQLRVGQIQYFIKHELSYNKKDCIHKMQHIFAFVLWKQHHHCYDYFGQSAIMCEDTNDVTGPSSFLPVQRIIYRCAYGKIKCNPEGFEETVFIACPIPIRHSI